MTYTDYNINVNQNNTNAFDPFRVKKIFATNIFYREI